MKLYDYADPDATVRRPAIPRKQFVAWDVTQVNTVLVPAIVERPEIVQEADSPYQSVQFAILAIVLTAVTGLVLLATRHTDGFLYNTMLVALVLFSWSIIGYEFMLKKSFSYGLLTANIVLIVLFLMAWFCLALVFVLPNSGLAPYLAVTPGPHPCPNHYLLRDYHHVPMCVELPLPKGVH